MSNLLKRASYIISAADQFAAVLLYISCQEQKRKFL